MAANRHPAARCSAALLFGLCMVAGPGAVAGQVVGDGPPASTLAGADSGPWMVGGSVGVPGLRTVPVFGAFTVGLHVAYLPAGPVGLDLSVGTAPVGFMHGVLPIGARSGVVFPLRGGSGALLPSAGVSYVAVAGETGVEGGLGPHVGAAMLSGTGLRLGVTLHWVAGESVPVWLLELGFLRRRPGAP